jgi:ribosomal protein L27
MENTNNDTTTVVDATNNLGVGSDQTAFTGTNDGASFQSSGGVRDVISGANPSGSFDFDGVDDSISLGNVPHSKPVTVMAWFNADSFTNTKNPRVLSSTNNGLEGLRFFLEDDGTVKYETKDSSSSAAIQSSPNNTGKNIHVAMTVGSSFIAYLNGSNVGSRSSAPLSAVNPISLGEAGGGTGENFNGIIDGVRIYDRILSGIEINQIYENTDPDQ